MLVVLNNTIICRSAEILHSFPDYEIKFQLDAVAIRVVKLQLK